MIFLGILKKKNQGKEDGPESRNRTDGGGPVLFSDLTLYGFNGIA